MNCPDCGEKTRVFDSRGSSNNWRRRRECTKCGRRFTTLEQAIPEVEETEPQQPKTRLRMIREMSVTKMTNRIAARAMDCICDIVCPNGCVASASDKKGCKTRIRAWLEEEI